MAPSISTWNPSTRSRSMRRKTLPTLPETTPPAVLNTTSLAVRDKTLSCPRWSLPIGEGHIERIHVTRPFLDGSPVSESDLLRLRAVMVMERGSSGMPPISNGCCVRWRRGSKSYRCSTRRNWSICMELGIRVWGGGIVWCWGQY